MRGGVHDGFFRTADDGNKGWFVDGGGAANRLGDPKELHTLHSGLHQSVTVESGVDEVPNLVLAHEVNLATRRRHPKT